MQENRTSDNLFHDPVLIAEVADIASIAINSSGTPLGVGYDLCDQVFLNPKTTSEKHQNLTYVINPGQSNNLRSNL